MPGRYNYQWDSHGLPVYRYEGGSFEDSSGACFILGNSRITAFAHVNGQLELISGERGWASINRTEQLRPMNRALLTCHGNTFVLTDEGAFSCREFGVGYARYRAELHDGITVTRTFCTLPSSNPNEGVPAVAVRIEIENKGETEISGKYREEYPIAYTMISALEDQTGDAPKVRYANESVSTGFPGLAAFQVRFSTKQLLLSAASPRDRHPYDCFPPVVFLHGQNGSACTESDTLVYEREFCLAPRCAEQLEFVIGFSFDGIEKIGKTVSALESSSAEEIAGRWKRQLPVFSSEPDDTLRWEMLWNAYVLKCMATYHRYFDATFIPQGSVYAYRLGQNASGRDHCQHLLPMIYADPALAKSCLRFALEHECVDGRILRQDIGYGYEDAGIYMESDAQLYVFMAVSEYLLTTGDIAFLRESLPYYPIENRDSGTVFDHLLRAFLWMRDVVRTGAHGLMRMLNSDWSDSFFHPYSPNIYVGSAESHLNTAMALAVLPRLGKALEQWSPAAQLIQEIDALRAQLYRAMMRDLEGRVYAPRCYLGENDELQFGTDSLCLEPQIWLLLAEDFPVGRKRELWRAIRETVLDMEPYGARTREKPLWDREGKGEDGGIWFSHQGVLMKGLLTFSKPDAEELLHKLTFRHFAECYPNYWLGHWTAADSVESTLSSREGHYHAWIDRAFQPFCAHAHAWMLYCYYCLKTV